MSTFLDRVAYHTRDAHIHVGPSAKCDECCGSFHVSERDARGRFRSVADRQRELDELNAPSFSRSTCDSCGSTLGGDRHAAHSAHPTYGTIHWDVCTDCVLFFANGDVPNDE